MPPMRDTLHADLLSLRDELGEQMRARHDRDLPFEELLSDRWERARRLGFGEGANIYSSAIVMFDVHVGAHTWVGPWVLLDGRAGIEIGDWCSISAGVQIYSHDTVKWALSGGRDDFALGAVRIGSRTHIGAQSTVLHGVSIGHHCVVGAHSLVNRDLEPFTIAFGVPARPRGRVLVDDATGEIELAID